MMTLLFKIFITAGSAATIGFGIWHFFVPTAWNWYSYIDPKAKELIVAVRAINVFFSLSLVLFGLVNILFTYGNHSNKYSIIVILAMTSVLWMTRSIFQIVYPQGTLYPGLQYGMLSAFLFITICYLASLFIILFQKV